MKFTIVPFTIFTLCHQFVTANVTLHSHVQKSTTFQTKREQRPYPSSTTTTVRGGGAQESLTFVQRLWTGGSSRAIAQFLLYPVDALRTLAQTREGQTLADVGLSSLIRGSLTTSMFATGMGAIQFAVFGICRDKVGPLVASALGAASSCVVSVPQEVIKQRLVTGIYPSFGAAVSSIFQAQGWRGFYTAWKPTMARNVPFVMITFTSKDIFQSLLVSSRKEPKSSLSTMETILVGMSAALVAGAITQPIDVVKTRLMTQAASNQVPYKNALDCFRTILRTEGLATLYAGFRQRSTYMCLLWGVTFALNGRLEQVLLQKRDAGGKSVRKKS